jgi:hypothetical protein
LAEKVIPEIERRTGVSFEYVPVLLGDSDGNETPADSTHSERKTKS